MLLLWESELLASFYWEGRAAAGSPLSRWQHRVVLAFTSNRNNLNPSTSWVGETFGSLSPPFPCTARVPQWGQGLRHPLGNAK